MAVPNRDGTKILFASNWDNNNIMTDPNPPAWILEYPQALSVEEETFNDNDLIVFPNPTTDIINVKVKGHLEVTNIQLTDMLGRTLINRSVDTHNDDIILNLSPYPKGMYLLSVMINGNAITKKVILN